MTNTGTTDGYIQSLIDDIAVYRDINIKQAEKIKRLKNDARKLVLDELRERLPEHPPLRGPINAFLDDFEKDRLK